MRLYAGVLVLLNVALMCGARDYYDKLDRYLIACHSTDFTCFKKQYQSFRDNFLLGNSRLGVEDYEPYYFRYGDSGTCIKMSGLEESSLTGIGIDSDTNFYTMVLEMPLKIEQVENNTKSCSAPAHEFHNIAKRDSGPLKRFTGNAVRENIVRKPARSSCILSEPGVHYDHDPRCGKSGYYNWSDCHLTSVTLGQGNQTTADHASIQITYPYDLKKKKGQMHMILGEEGLDVILDIPDLTDLVAMTDEDLKEYELSEWAYELVQHVDAAQDFVLPFTNRFHNITEKIPLERYLLLYPEEEYTDLHFAFSESLFFDVTSNK